LVAYRLFTKTYHSKKSNTTDKNALIQSDQKKAIDERDNALTKQKWDLQQRIQEIRKTEELIQSNLREIEIESKKLTHDKEELQIKQQEIEDKEKALKKVRMVLGKQKEEIDRMNIHKNEFMTNMSHELKTPLNSVLTLTQVLIKNREDNLTEKQLKFLRTVYSSGKTLLSLINDVLDIAKIESGKTETFIEPIDIQAIKDEITETFYAEQISKNLTFEFEIDENVPGTIYSDKKRLLQILRNILSNAFKFTDNGYVKFKILSHDSALSTTTSLLSADNYIVFSIEDTGLGIEEDKQKVIFEEFVQADGSTTRNYGGTGLGLAISQKLTTLLGGEIKLKSEYGKGSTFNVYLPVSRKHKKQKSKQVIIKERTTLTAEENLINTLTEEDMKKYMKSKKIFIITKDMKYLFLLTNFLEDFKAIVNGTNNPIEGLSKLDNNPDATFLVLDEYIAKDDQYKIITKISSNQRLEDVPIGIISQSNTSKEALLEEFSDYNVCCILPKDFDKSYIMKEISALISNQKRKGVMS